MAFAPLTPPQLLEEAATASAGFASPATDHGHPLLPPPVAGPRLIDAKAIGKLKTFSGKEEDWPAWVFVARSYVYFHRKLKGSP